MSAAVSVNVKFEGSRVEIEISTDIEKLDVEAIYDFISNRSYWGKGRTVEQVRKTLTHSICFGAYVNGTFSGFTRVVTDTVAFAYVLDLFVLENYRGLGVGRRLVEAMLSHKDLQSTNWLLGTQDAHGLYAKYGFQTVSDPNRYMKRVGACSR